MVWLLVLGVTGAGFSNFRLEANYRAFFAKGDPLVASLDDMRDTYDSGDTQAILIKTRDGDLFSRRGLAAIEEVTDLSWALPYTIRVESLANFPHTQGTDDELIVNDLITRAEELSDAQIREIREYALSEPLLLRALVTPKGDATLVLASFTRETSESLAATQEVYDAGMRIRDEMRAKYPEFEFYVTGVVAGGAAFTEAASSDGEVLIPLGLFSALFAMFLYLWYESGRAGTAGSGLVGSLAVIQVAVLIPLGLMGWAGVAANNITSVIPIVILTLAVADSLHILISYFQFLREGQEKRQALLESLRLNAEPVWLTSITTMLGFLALNNSDSPPFQQMGNLVAIGVIVAWAAANTLLPAVLALMPASVSEASRKRFNPMPRVAGWLIRWRNFVLICGVLGLVGSIYGIQQNKLNEKWSGYIARDTAFGTATYELLDSFVDINTVEYSLDSGKENGIYELDYLNKLAAFSEWLRAQPEVLYVQSLDQTLKRLNKNIHGDDPTYHRMPEDEVEAAQYLLLYEMSLPFGASMTNQVSFDKSSTRVIVGLHTSDTAVHLGFMDRVAGWFEANAPELTHPGTGSTTIMANLAHRDAIGMLWGTALVLLVISISVTIVFRSPGYGLLTMLVNAMPAVTALGIWGLTVGQVGLSVSMVFAASLGIIVDYGVHFLSKYRRARIEKGYSAEEAVKYAYSTVGVALLVTTAVLVINFGILGFSDFLLNVYMGVLTAITIVLALLAEMIFLPAMLLLTAGFMGRKKPA